MKKYLIPSMFLLLIVAATGCGASQNSNQAGSSGGASKVTQGTVGVSGTTSPSQSSAPIAKPTVTVTVGAAKYAQTDTIQVIFTNTSQITLGAYPVHTGCSIAQVQEQVNGVWKDSSVNACADTKNATFVKMTPGQSITVTITAANFAPGTYRIAFMGTNPQIGMVAQMVITAYSSDFTIS